MILRTQIMVDKVGHLKFDHHETNENIGNKDLEKEYTTSGAEEEYHSEVVNNEEKEASSTIQQSYIVVRNDEEDLPTQDRRHNKLPKGSYTTRKNDLGLRTAMRIQKGVEDGSKLKGKLLKRSTIATGKYPNNFDVLNDVAGEIIRDVDFDKVDWSLESSKCRHISL